ncbi:MAG: hypothetical protein U0487_03800 [Patescibacteria group bacterium]
MKHKKIRSLYSSYDEAVKNLKIGDIVFFHGKIGLNRSLIRKVGDSYWTHVALVFDIVKSGDEILSVILIEANESIRIHRLESFANQDYEYDIGFKRIPGLTAKEIDRFRGFFLDAIDVNYDYKYVFYLIVRYVLSNLFGTDASERLIRHISTTDTYICSTFVQRALYLAVEPERRRESLFLGNDVPFVYAQGLVLPKDIAISKNTVWLFNAHD